MTAPRTSSPPARGVTLADLAPTGYERVQLGYALVQWVAEREGLQVLHIKGPVVAAQFPGPDRQSVDIDVLASPSGAGLLSERLTALGWVQLHEHDEFGLGLHAAVLSHPGWGITMDLHHYFPGFYRPADEVFRVLWQRRSVVQIAGRACPCPDRVAHGLILLMHAARNLGSTKAEDDISRVLDAFSADDRAELISLARELGALAALDVVTPTGALTAAQSAQARYWRLHAMGAPGAVLWLGALGAEPTWHGRLQVLRGAVAPRLPPGQVQWHDRADFARHLAEHWSRGARQVPHIIRMLVDHDSARKDRR